MDVDSANEMVGEESVSSGLMDQKEVNEDVSNAPKVTEPKPWKVKKKALETFRAVSPLNDIEIYESKVVTLGARDIDVTSPETGYLCIRCQGDEEFYIPSHVVDCFQCVDIILHGDGEYLWYGESLINGCSILTCSFSMLKAGKYIPIVIGIAELGCQCTTMVCDVLLCLYRLSPLTRIER